MTKARPQYAGASYRYTIRCSERRYMLSPGYPEVANLMGYMFSTAANRYGILVHSLCVMSNHLHADCTDPNGRWSDFCRDFASQSARALNAFHGRWEATWTKSSSQEVVTRQAALNGMACTIANPVRAGLVAAPRAWPGLMTCAEDIPTAKGTCTAWEFTRPTFFFRHEEDGGLPDRSTLYITPHPLAGEDPAGFAADLSKEVARICRDKRREVRKAGGRFAGAAAVCRKRWWQSPNTAEPRRELEPQFAEPDPEVRRQLLKERKLFTVEYTASIRQWRETGQAVFPPGTCAMRGMPGVTIRAGPRPFQRA